MADLSTHPDVSEATREESRLRFAESRRKRLKIEDAGEALDQCRAEPRGATGLGNEGSLNCHLGEGL